MNSRDRLGVGFNGVGDKNPTPNLHGYRYGESDILNLRFTEISIVF